MESERQAVESASELQERVRALIAQTGPDVDGDAGFNRLALDLFRFQFERVPIYRRVCEMRGVGPGGIDHWSRIPALPTSAFKEHVVSSLAESERSRVFHSSGTTGHVPSRHYHSAGSLSLYEASLLPWFERHFPVAGAALVFLTPPADLAPHSSLVHMFDTIRRRGAGDSLFAGAVEADGSWSVDFNRLAAAVGGAVAANRPVGLLGTAFSFVHWLDHLAVKKTPQRLPAGSSILETGGYKGRSRAVARADLRRLMTKHLGVPESRIVAEYGMSELSSQAYDGVAGQTRQAAGLFRFPPWVRIRIISPETGADAASGETGLLRVFDPANMYSVMAIQTEDLAASRGDGFELLGRAESAGPRGCSLMAAS
jgi:hypothetical protein